MTRISVTEYAAGDGGDSDSSSSSISPPASPVLPHPPVPLSLPRSPSPVHSSPTRRVPFEWVPLREHPVFPTLVSDVNLVGEVTDKATSSVNLLAWDASSSRLYVWDTAARCVHRLALRFRDSDQTSSPSVLEAAVPSEILLPDIQIRFVVNQISLNMDGSSLLLASSNNLRLMYIYEKVSITDQRICRTICIASSTFTGQYYGLQTLQVSWHPYSSYHLGILSSDSVFRLYDFASDLERPEQEYYLQPVTPEKCQNAASLCPVSFSFGSQHLWDRFSVFFLFSDGSVFILCPVVPFRSVCRQEHIEEIYDDLSTFGLKSSDPNVVSNSHMAISWLEATFPGVADRSVEGSSTLFSRAHPYSPMGASLSLQGPLVSIHLRQSNPEINTICEGRAVGFLYSSIGKDSVFVTSWSSGQLQIDALTDEVQPQWNSGTPCLDVDSHGNIKGVAMICEPYMSKVSIAKFNKPINLGSSESSAGRVSMGYQPPLLRLAIVDLSLPKHALETRSLSLFPDPLVRERFYCLHGGGIDLISIHFLPFTDVIPCGNVPPKAPSVHPILSPLSEDSVSPALLGFTAIADLYGDSQIVCLSSSYECIVLEMKAWNEKQPLQYDMSNLTVSDIQGSIPEIISKELLSGPETILIPSSTTLRSLSADSINGQSTLHHYIKLFHENYVEYAHKVYIELKEHNVYLQAILKDQNMRLRELKQRLLNVEKKDAGITNRISHAFKVYELLDQRLQNFKTLPAASKKPLTRAEQEFKAELERFGDVELDALRSACRALSSRLKRHNQTSPANAPNRIRQVPRGRSIVSDPQIAQLKASLEALSLLNKENVKKVKVIEDGLKNKEK